MVRYRADSEKIKRPFRSLACRRSLPLCQFGEWVRNEEKRLRQLSDRESKPASATGVKLEKLWGKPEAREYLGVSARTLDYWIAARIIPFIKFPSAVRFLPDDVRRWVESRRVD